MFNLNVIWIVLMHAICQLLKFYFTWQYSYTWLLIPLVLYKKSIDLAYLCIFCTAFSSEIIVVHFYWFHQLCIVINNIRIFTFPLNFYRQRMFSLYAWWTTLVKISDFFCTYHSSWQTDLLWTRAGKHKRILQENCYR